MKAYGTMTATPPTLSTAPGHDNIDDDSHVTLPYIVNGVKDKKAKDTNLNFTVKVSYIEVCAQEYPHNFQCQPTYRPELKKFPLLSTHLSIILLLSVGF
jgi:hypothetical protein